MAFNQLIYFYIILLSVLINPKDVMSLKRVRETNKPPFTSPTSPAISAVLLECPKNHKRSDSRPDCERQMMVHIRVSPTFQIESLDKFLLLDEVYDQRRQTRAKLMSPYLIEISRGEPVIMYPLQFSKSIRCDTCGHKLSNITSGANCNQHQPLAPQKAPLINSATGETEMGTAASAHPFAPAKSAGFHPPRCAKQQALKEKQNQQQFADSKESHNPKPKPAENVESQHQQKISIGILDASASVQPKNPTNVEEYFPSNDMLLRNVENNGGVYGMEYDGDEYDERNFNEDIGSEGESGLAVQSSFRNKRLKTQALDSPISDSLKVDDALTENEKLFREAEHKSEEARLDAINVFRMKYGHPVGTVIGTSALAGDDNVARYGPSSSANAGKPHVAGIQEDCIRPQGEFDADGVDGDVDVVGGRVATVQKQNPGTQSRLNSGCGHQLAAISQKKPHLVALQKSQSKWPGAQFPASKLQFPKGSTGSQRDPFSSNTNSESAFQSKPKGVIGSLRLWQAKNHHQEPDDSNDDISHKTLQFSQDIDSSAGSNVDATEEDYDRVDASGHDTSVIESKNNIAKIGDVESEAGGMGDEFYWNTLNYPQAKDPGTNYDKNMELGRTTFSNYKIGALKDGKFLETSLSRNTPKRLSSSSQKVVKSRVPVRGNGATASTRNLNNDQSIGHDNSARSTFSNSKRHRIRTRAKAPDKSTITTSRLKIRSSDNAGGEPAEGVVETSGNYVRGGLIPAFPLNGYPGYLGVKVSSEFVPPPPMQSHYKLLQNVPNEYVPHQPAFAKELGDPNLTVNDKIHLLDVLATGDDVNDEILRKLENELDAGVIIHDPNNHDRIPMPGDKKKKGVAKRSYVMYDDLTMRDTYDQYDEFESERLVDVPLTDGQNPNLSLSGAGSDFIEGLVSGDVPNFSNDPVSRADEEDETCMLCDGDKCTSKTPGGRNCLCDRKGRHCKCTQNMQKVGKKIRSVTDAWYSVFNMSAPLQFLTTRVGIYRKRHGAWWRIAPSITLTSLSGIYANGNLSILFSSHVDIFQLRRPLTLEHHKLLVPHDSADAAGIHPNAFNSIDPADILAIDINKFNFNEMLDDTGNDNKEKDQIDASAKSSLCEAAISVAERRRKRRSHSSSDTVLSIGDLGYFPGNMNILEKCPTDQKHLCLNMLDEEVPSFTVKIKQPFLENALIFPGDYKVRIASVISDATTRGALQVAVNLVNEGLVSHEFAVCISNCPMTFGAKTTVKKDLAPYVGETISFLLPLEENKDTKLHCKLEVKSPDQKVISKRKFTIEPTARCLCIWDCDCHCIQDLISHNDYDVCHKLDKCEEYAAGFVDASGCGPLDDELTGWQWFWWRMNHYAFSLLLFMLFLGFLKAVMGAFGQQRIDKYGYNYVQPLQKYEYASRYRRFFINILFFIVLPFIFCCKCFTPTEEDLLIASTEWQCTVIQQDLSEDSSGDGRDGGAGGRRGGWKRFGRSTDDGNYANDNDDDDDEETILSQRFESGEGSQAMGLEVSQTMFSEYLMNSCDYDEAEEERDTHYVLKALSESRESIRKLLNAHCSGDLDPNNPLKKDAELLVRKLIATKIVYRTFDIPLMNVDVPVGQKYSIRGYFMPSIGSGYQYFTPSPLAQLRRITDNTGVPSLPPVILRADEFTRVYANKCEVLEAGDLSVEPPEDAPCINCSNDAISSQLETSPPLNASGSTANAAGSKVDDQ